MAEKTVLFAFGLTTVAGLSTLIGAIITVFFKKRNDNVFAACASFAGGCMMYITLVEVFPSSVEFFSEENSPSLAYLLASVYLFVGLAVYLVFDFAMSYLTGIDIASEPPSSDAGIKKKMRKLRKVNVAISAELTRVWKKMTKVSDKDVSPCSTPLSADDPAAANCAQVADEKSISNGTVAATDFRKDDQVCVGLSHFSEDFNSNFSRQQQGSNPHMEEPVHHLPEEKAIYFSSCGSNEKNGEVGQVKPHMRKRVFDDITSEGDRFACEFSKMFDSAHDGGVPVCEACVEAGILEGHEVSRYLGGIAPTRTPIKKPKGGLSAFLSQLNRGVSPATCLKKVPETSVDELRYPHKAGFSGIDMASGGHADSRNSHENLAHGVVPVSLHTSGNGTTAIADECLAIGTTAATSIKASRSLSGARLKSCLPSHEKVYRLVYYSPYHSKGWRSSSNSIRKEQASKNSHLHASNLNSSHASDSMIQGRANLNSLGPLSLTAWDNSHVDTHPSSTIDEEKARKYQEEDILEKNRQKGLMNISEAVLHVASLDVSGRYSRIMDSSYESDFAHWNAGETTDNSPNECEKSQFDIDNSEQGNACNEGIGPASPSASLPRHNFAVISGDVQLPEVAFGGVVVADVYRTLSSGDAVPGRSFVCVLCGASVGQEQSPQGWVLVPHHENKGWRVGRSALEGEKSSKKATSDAIIQYGMLPYTDCTNDGEGVGTLNRGYAADLTSLEEGRCVSPVNSKDLALARGNNDTSHSAASRTSTDNNVSEASKKKQSYRVVAIAMGLGLTVHNLPEGLVTFVSTMSNPSSGIGVALAIALHNIPEGVAVSVPVYYATGSIGKAFFWTMVCGLAEPLGGLLGFFFLNYLQDGYNTNGIVMAITGGMMLYVTVKKLIPAAHGYDLENKVASWFLIGGMFVMALSLSILEFYG